MDYSMMDYAFFQGRIVPFADAKISIGTHSVQYGTGAFAGIRGYLDEDGEIDQRLPPSRPRPRGCSTPDSCSAPSCPSTAESLADVDRVAGRRERAEAATSTSGRSSTSPPSSSRHVYAGSATNSPST